MAWLDDVPLQSYDVMLPVYVRTLAMSNNQTLRAILLNVWWFFSLIQIRVILYMMKLKEEPRTTRLISIRFWNNLNTQIFRPVQSRSRRVGWRRRTLDDDDFEWIRRCCSGEFAANVYGLVFPFNLGFLPFYNSFCVWLLIWFVVGSWDMVNFFGIIFLLKGFFFFFFFFLIFFFKKRVGPFDRGEF